jgi:hypothetical protein
MDLRLQFYAASLFGHDSKLTWFIAQWLAEAVFDESVLTVERDLAPARQEVSVAV